VTELRDITDREMDALLALFSENATIVLSGSRIAKELGISRHSIWRRIRKLRALGFNVQGRPGTGYHIEHLPDILSPRLLRRQLRGSTFGKRIYHFFKTNSTNNVAMKLGEEGEPHGAVVLAEEQTAGRGRAGRKWISEPMAGIHATILVRPGVPPSQAPLLTLVAGVATHDAVTEQTGIEADIRWPNDILIQGRKCAGILTELRAEPDRVHFAAIGIGVNINQERMPCELANLATSLRIATGRMHSRVEFLARLLRSLEHYYNLFIARGAAPLIERFAAVSSFYEGKRVRISSSTETFIGTTAGLEPTGILRVRRNNGRIEAVLSGDVSEAS
jgi:BirA family biotin operon repressor/biotin-[acetyl-CoA-carboxylase] ligase